MKLEIKPRDRRALFILASALVFITSLSYVVFPAYDELKLASASADDKEDQLRKYRRALNRKGRYAQLIPTARQQVAAAEAVLIRGDNASLATAELQALVEEVTKNSNVAVAQRNVLAPKKLDEFYNEISMSLAFDATPSELTNFLTSIRTAPKFLTLKTMQVLPKEPLNAVPAAPGEYRKAVRVTAAIAAIVEPAEKAQ